MASVSSDVATMVSDNRMFEATATNRDDSDASSNYDDENADHSDEECAYTHYYSQKSGGGGGGRSPGSVSVINSSPTVTPQQNIPPQSHHRALSETIITNTKQLDHQPRRMLAGEDTDLLDQLDRAQYDRDRLQMLLDKSQQELQAVRMQNTDMWKTLNKQRTMILDLQQDLQEISVELRDKKQHETEQGQSSPGFEFNEDGKEEIKVRKRPPPIEVPLPSPTMKKSASETPVSATEQSLRRHLRTTSLQPMPRPKKDHRTLRLSMSMSKNQLHEREVIIKVQPNELPSISVEVYSTLVCGTVKKRGGEVAAVFSCTDLDNPDNVLWKLTKDYASLAELEANVRPHLGQYNVPKLPEKVLFQSSAPVKVDQRRQQLNAYFSELLKVPLLPKATLEFICQFLSTNVDEFFNEIVPGQRGFLSKKGKKFSGWKARYFVLEGSYLNYYDRPGAHLAGTISLYKAKIGRQEADPDNETDYRHGLQIIEWKKKDSFQTHLLCAESDDDREEWIKTCLSMVDTPPYCELPSSGGGGGSPSKHRSMSLRHRNSNSTLSPPPSITSNDGMSSVTVLTPQSPHHNQFNHPYFRHASVGGDHQGTQDDEMYNDVRVRPKSAIAGARKLRLFKRGSDPIDEDLNESCGDTGIEKALNELGCNNEETSESSTSETFDENREHVFGVPLARAVELSGKDIGGKVVPSVVFRCLQVLDKNDAWYEEGLFRLSGSSTTVKMLKSRFNHEFDVDMEAMGTETHTATSLLKQYLRDLPDTLIPHPMQADFRKALNLQPLQMRINELTSLVHQLPSANHDLLYVLCSIFTKVLENSALNKMNLKNLSIVTSPAVHIPPNMFAGLMADYQSIFDGEPVDETKVRSIEVPPSLA